MAGLDVLAEPPPALRPGEPDPRFPSLTDAIHWFIDDTWWDQRSPNDSVGSILRPGAEAEAVTAAITALLPILDELGPAADDCDYFGHCNWYIVRSAAAFAADVMRNSYG